MADKLRIAYCDDESVQLLYMKHLIAEWEQQANKLCELSTFKSAKAFLFEHKDNYPFDVLFLDIDMGGMDGMELARTIRNYDSKIPLVFLTNRQEYVFEGYEVNAFRYLLKPLDLSKLTFVLDEVYKNCFKEKCYLIEKQEGETIKVDLEDIYYIEANGHYLNLCLKAKSYRVKKSFKEVTNHILNSYSSLEEAGFIYTHRSYLVNLKFVEKVLRTECIMANEALIPISRTMYKNVNDTFIHYYLK